MPGLVPGIRVFEHVDRRDVKLVLGPAEGRTRGPGDDEKKLMGSLPCGPRVRARAKFHIIVVDMKLYLVLVSLT
jgi:hypothetical protein